MKNEIDMAVYEKILSLNMNALLKARENKRLLQLNLYLSPNGILEHVVIHPPNRCPPDLRRSLNVRIVSCAILIWFPATLSSLH